MAETLDKKVKELFDSHDLLAEQEAHLVVVKEDLTKKKEGLKKAVFELKKRMREGERLSTPRSDYCFYHFGINAQRNKSKVKQFCSRLKNLVDQAILINYSGGAVITTSIEDPYQRFEREIRVGRLIAPGYSFSLDGGTNARDLVATVKDLEKLNVKTGRWRGDKDDLIIDPEFLISPGGHIKFQIKGKQEIEGIHVNLLVPEPDPKNPPIGQTTSYDSDICASLRVGNDYVKRYLKDLKIKAEKTIIPQVPTIYTPQS